MLFKTVSNGNTPDKEKRKVVLPSMYCVRKDPGLMMTLQVVVEHDVE